MIPLPPETTLFPTRRSSDLHHPQQVAPARREPGRVVADPPVRLVPRLVVEVDIVDRGGIRGGGVDQAPQPGLAAITGRDRKSTRLNSSHRCISYAVFSLKKK